MSMHPSLALAPLLTLALLGCRDKTTVEPDTGDPVAQATDADSDGYLTDEDCDDDDATVSPGADEVCDGIDNNCDGTIDEGVTSTFYGDDDGDGFGNPDATIDACEAPTGTVSIPNDCDDSSADTYPGAAERCDEEDNDCDGTVDEDVRTEWYADADDDGYGDPDSAYAVCDPPPGYVDNPDDCDDTDELALPGGVEICDEADNDCDGTVDEGVTTTFYQDTDSDGFGVSDTTTESCSLPTGYASRSGDCDDGDGGISPNAAEVCDSIDNDCDGTADEDDAVDADIWYADTDSDGYGSASSVRACAAPSGYVDNADDCDDTNDSTSPGEREVCDSIDNDCDGDTDEASATDAARWYADTDSDGYGSTAASTVACDAPSGFAASSGDCDDGDATSYPGGVEVCDEADNDCDGTTDEGVTTTFYRDSDSDGQGDPATTIAACAPPSGYVTTAADCDDGDAAISPNAAELCDEVDNDCDGDTDEDDAADAADWYADSDGDGYGVSTSATTSCTQPSGHALLSGDCDDADEDANPGEKEVCDSIDNDCDGSTDEGVTNTFYVDDDGDGYGAAATTLAACEAPSGYADNSEDCDDDNADANPDAEEVADGVDNDCDGAGLNGDYRAASSVTLAGGVWEFTSFEITAAATVTVTGSDPLELYVLEDAVIDGTLDLSGDDGARIGPMAYVLPAGGDGGGGGGGDGGDASAYHVTGYPYGAASAGTGDAPGGGGIGYSSGSGGGGGGQVTTGDTGGSAGGCYTSLAGGAGGLAVNSTSSPTLTPGSGGGGGGYGTGYNSDGGGGGGGGGALYIEAADIDISGSIYCYGGDGGGNTTGSGYHAAGGGGGSGGTLWLLSPAVSVSGTINCSGGAGGAAYYAGHCGIAGDGGDGASGLVYIDTDSLSVTGGIAPSYTVP